MPRPGHRFEKDVRGKVSLYSVDDSLRSAEKLTGVKLWGFVLVGTNLLLAALAMAAVFVPKVYNDVERRPLWAAGAEAVVVFVVVCLLVMLATSLLGRAFFGRKRR